MTGWTVVDLTPARTKSATPDTAVSSVAKRRDPIEDAVERVFAGEGAAPAKPNLFDQFDQKPTGNVFDRFDTPAPFDELVPAQQPSGEWEVVDLPVEDRGLIEGILSDVRNALGFEQTPKEIAQRERAKRNYDEQRGAGGWKDTLFSKDGVRLVAQGATLGAADEMEAGVRALGSETYDDALASVRSDLATARAKPGALPIELGAGFLVPGGAAASSLRAAPSIWRAAKYGAGMGAAAGFSGEEGKSDSDAIRALDAGRSVNLKDGAGTEQFAASLDNMDEWSRRQARLGVLQRVRDDVRNTAEAPGAIRSVAESPARAQNLADILAPRVDEFDLGPATSKALEDVPRVFDREARTVRGAQSLRAGMPDYEGGLRGALHGVDPASVATQPHASLTRAAVRYASDPMSKRRAALVTQLLLGDYRHAAAVARAQLAQRGVSIGDLTTRANGAVAAMQSMLSGYRPVQ